ncbi:MAG: NAD(P)-binding domain-containing protein [Deltaproteobacteria bacterium]|nr:NAD(P)-binding domain-containing protein [Deltaproteobacteria bacterium]
MTRYVVMGAGAIGGAVGARLHEAGCDVVLVARGAHGAAMAAHGLELAEPDRVRRVRAPVVLDPASLHLGADDVVLLAVKSQHTEAALDALPLTRAVPVVCLQNGVRNEDCALARVDHVLGAMVWSPATLLVPGRVEVHAAPPGLILLGPWAGPCDALADAVAADLCKAGFVARAEPEIRAYKYTKLLTNLVGPAQALCGPEGVTRALRTRLREEGEAALTAAGIPFVPAQALLARAAAVKDAPVEGAPRQGGSTWQSFARGAGSAETEHLNGEIVRLGRLHGVDVTVNARLVAASEAALREGWRPGAVTAEALLAGT